MIKRTTRFAALTLSAALTLGSALAAGTAERFPVLQTYPGYEDVQQSDWFYENAKLCYEIGLMQGTQNGFEPNMTLTIGQVAAIAARMRESLTGQAIPAPVPNPGIPWYQHYVDYLVAAGISVPSPEQNASRLEFVKLLSAVLSSDELAPINEITALPDTEDSDVLAFYNAGILTGVNQYGSFAAERTLMRSECAAMVSRIARTELRSAFTPADYTPFRAAYVTPETVMFSNGVTAEQFLREVNHRIANWEMSLRQSGSDFNWKLPVEDGRTVLEHIQEETLSSFGVTDKSQGTQSYQDFDFQVYYARLIQFTGKLLGWEDESGANISEGS